MSITAMEQKMNPSKGLLLAETEDIYDRGHPAKPRTFL